MPKKVNYQAKFPSGFENVTLILCKEALTMLVTVLYFLPYSWPVPDVAELTQAEVS